MKVLLTTFLAAGYTHAPFGCGSLAAYLRTNSCPGYQVDVTVSSFPATMPGRIAAERVACAGADVVGVSSYIWNHNKCVEFLPLLRRAMPYCVAVVGGPQVADRPDEYDRLLQSGLVDYIVTGDGEEALSEIVNEVAVQPGPRRGDTACRRMSGFVADLDQLPNPYESSPTLRADLARTKIAFIEGSRGCPFTCTFCDQGWRQPRVRSVELLERDLRYVYANGARELIFFDPTFNFDRARTVRVLNYIGEHLRGVRLHAEVKADILTDTIINALGSLRRTSVEVGLQSSNPATLATLRRPTDLERLAHNTHRLVESGVKVWVNTIYGLPGESLADWMASLDFCYNLGDVSITASGLKILPNTEIEAHSAELRLQYANGTMASVTETGSMSEKDIRTARQMERILHWLCEAPADIRKHLRSTIGRCYGGSLAHFLCVVVSGGLPSSLGSLMV